MDYLLDESPLVVMPTLATAIGLHEAMVVQQIQYWLKINEKTNKNFYDGHYWTYNTFEEWQKQFPFWTTRTIQNIIAKLEKQGYLISANYNKSKFDRTKWYTINYEKIGEVLPLRKTFVMDNEPFSSPIPETTLTETNNKEIKAQTSRSRTSKFLSTLVADYGEQRVEDAIKAVNDYIDVDYPSATKRAHPQEGKYKRAVFAEKLLRCADETDTDDEIVFDALLIALERCPDDVDPQIYYATGSKVLGNALMATGEIVFEQIQTTDYDFSL